jgi:hypothetical protein
MAAQYHGLPIRGESMLVTAHLLDKICSLKESSIRPVREGVLTLALEIAHEGRGEERSAPYLWCLIPKRC